MWCQKVKPLSSTSSHPNPVVFIYGVSCRMRPPVDSVALFLWLNAMVYGRYNELVHGGYFMVYKPKSKTAGGPSCRNPMSSTMDGYKRPAPSSTAFKSSGLLSVRSHGAEKASRKTIDVLDDFMTNGWLNGWLVVWNISIIFPIILGMSSSQLTNSIIFQRGGEKPPTRIKLGLNWDFMVSLWCISLVLLGLI